MKSTYTTINMFDLWLGASCIIKVSLVLMSYSNNIGVPKTEYSFPVCSCLACLVSALFQSHLNSRDVAGLFNIFNNLIQSTF